MNDGDDTDNGLANFKQTKKNMIFVLLVKLFHYSARPNSIGVIGDLAGLLQDEKQRVSVLGLMKQALKEIGPSSYMHFELV
jgi:hypothetical protein